MSVVKPMVYGLLLTIFLSISACEKDQDLCDPTPVFDIDLFIENLTAQLNNVSGYQLVVNQGGNLYYSDADGFSIYAVDPGGPLAMSVNTRMNVASVSKFIGTIALMQVLDKYNISIENPIHTYLPDSWKPLVHPDHFDGGSAYLIKFKNLLRMETAIAFTGNNWSPGIMPTADQMFTALQQPAAPNRWGVYQNGNFTLIRILIGEIEYNLNESSPDYNEMTTDKYFEYIKENIFDKLNLNPPMSVNDINTYYLANFTRAHQWPFDETFRDGNNNVGWGATSDPLLNGGSGGLVLSSIDLAKLIAFFKHDETGLIISGAQRNLILENELGLIETTTGENGVYQSKGGTRGPETATSRALRSRIMFYPNGVEVVLLVNCNITTMGTFLRTSFDDAWVSSC
jgi:CubicO group peptidase (beta-lactamase class C family)